MRPRGHRKACRCVVCSPATRRRVQNRPRRRRAPSWASLSDYTAAVKAHARASRKAQARGTWLSTSTPRRRRRKRNSLAGLLRVQRDARRRRTLSRPTRAKIAARLRSRRRAAAIFRSLGARNSLVGLRGVQRDARRHKKMSQAERLSLARIFRVHRSRRTPRGGRPKSYRVIYFR